MRFVPTFCLREGMLLGDNLFGKNGELVLVQNTVLTEDYIRGIQKQNFNGIYVDDDISKDLIIANIIDERVRAQTVKSVKDVFICSESKSSGAKQKFISMQKQIEQIVDEILGNQHMMINMVDLKVFDDYTYFHSVNVAVLSIVLGTSLGFNKEDLCNLGLGAILHDIGKIFVKKEILNKSGMLSDHEFEELKAHSSLGYNYIKKGFSISTSSKIGIRDHHEKYGGGGYPNNIMGSDISLFGRIISIADVYDAMTSDRPYRKAVKPSEVIEYIMGSSCTLFDPDLVSIFIRKIAPYPIGTCVKLSNGLTGIVTENYESYCMRPKIRIFKDGDKTITPYEINLADNTTLNITVTDVA
ncbi:HD-GYP domain-containing protein [Acetobacterium bakii]|uniref:Phosphohydrolase n=1 Tax=Acetobacterium bakii TaxID=52689 RepID=A0A0L6U4E1_9FIRM|nr:HD-GYP domain-containing protein [Acetobacterium bakii]KNZ43374.1 phosphohydrolase [Acetobacterium bakii]